MHHTQFIGEKWRTFIQDSPGEEKNVYIEGIHWKKGGLLGTGAFSSCFEAMDVTCGRLMAVKQVMYLIIVKITVGFYVILKELIFLK